HLSRFSERRVFQLLSVLFSTLKYTQRYFTGTALDADVHTIITILSFPFCFPLFSPLSLPTRLSASPLVLEPAMLQLLLVVLLMPQGSITDPRDERIMEFLKRSDVEAWETYLWNNPARTVTMNDIMITFKKQYNLDIAINYSSFPGTNR